MVACGCVYTRYNLQFYYDLISEWYRWSDTAFLSRYSNVCVIYTNIYRYCRRHHYCFSKVISLVIIKDGKRTELINNGTSVIAELTEGEIRNYYRGISLIGFENGGEYYYYKLNAHGDTIGILNSFGEQVKEYSYDAYGNQEYADIFDTNPFRYCGEYYDNETGIIYRTKFS